MISLIFEAGFLKRKSPVLVARGFFVSNEMLTAN